MPDQSLRPVTYNKLINKMAAEIMLNMIFNTHFKIKKDNKEKESKKKEIINQEPLLYPNPDPSSF